MKGNFKAYSLALIAIILWGFSFIWENHLIINNVGIFTFIFERMLLAAIMLWGVGLFMGNIMKIARCDYKWFLLLAFGEPFIYFIGETYGMKFIGSSVVTAVIIGTIPIFTLFAERIFYKSKITFLKALGVLISIPGVYFVVANGAKIGEVSVIGLLIFILSIVGALFYSFMVIKLSNKGYNVITLVVWQFTFGALLFLPLFLIFGLKGVNSFFFTYEVQSNIFALAIFCSCLCFSFWSYVTAKLGVTRSNIFSVLIPAVSLIVAHFYGQEQITLIRVAGIVIAAAGIILVQWKKEQN